MQDSETLAEKQLQSLEGDTCGDDNALYELPVGRRVRPAGGLDAAGRFI